MNQRKQVKKKTATSDNKEKGEDIFQPVTETEIDPLFDEETIRSYVKGFILAFIAGKIKISMPKKEEIEWLAKTMEGAGQLKIDKKTKTKYTFTQ